MATKPKNRLTLGLLADWTAAEYQMKIIFGAVEASRKHDVNLICIEGGCIQSSRQYESQRNLLYEMLNKNDVDGVIVFSGSIGLFASREQIGEFCHRYLPLPIVSIAQEVEGCGAVLVDNRTGLRELIVHLLEFHQYRDFAVISGPEDNQDGWIRLETIREVLAEYGIKLDENLIIPGNFTPSSGGDAVKMLLDQKKAHFDAVIAINDEMALGALEELNARNIKVPVEVAVVGFDNFDLGAYSVPPLTTVDQSLHEQGVQAVELLLNLIGNREAESKIVLPTKLVARETCGCFSQSTLFGQSSPKCHIEEDFESVISKNKEIVISEVLKSTQTFLGGEMNNGLYGLVEKLIDTVNDHFSSKKRDAFLKACHEVLNQALRSYDNIFLWQNIVSELRRHLLAYISDCQTLTQVEDMLHQLRILIGEKAIEKEKNYYHQSLYHNSFMSYISEELLSTFNVGHLVDALAEKLPQLGVSSGFVARLNLNSYDSDYERQLMMAYNKQGRIDIDQNDAYTDRLVPQVLWEDGERHAILVSSLNYATPFGIMGLELDLLDPSIYGSLRRLVCSSLNGVILSKQVEEQNIQSQREHTKSLAAMRNAVEGFIRTILYTMEMRDPYTAGHQSRVADLATAIAVEMELSQEMTEGIRIAGMVHDLGKISVPAEILNKPGRLRDSEMALIKDHPQVAFDILNNLDFPWPIAQIILQHHERLNGTGYPNGLKGDEIDLEAKIIAVADVIEAMASHRPYRPALGIDVALDEVTKHRGIAYDPDVVDACTTLFRDKGYALK